MSPADETLLADLLLEWEDRLERGEKVSAAELCGNRVDLVPVLEERIENLQQFSWKTMDDDDTDQEFTPQPPFVEPLAGRYRLDALIGEGGFGQVWRGVDLELQRPVAIKLPKPGRKLLAPGGEDRFLSEARKVARLAHPGIVTVYDVCPYGDSYFIVSELIDGYDLARRVRSGSLPVLESIKLVAEAASHLSFAHSLDFIHRDIKPANLLVGWDGHVHIADFGLAVSGVDMTADGGHASGTLAYMSPERLFADQGRIDDRADVYSLGVVLYELLTGRVPFVGDTPEQVREAIRKQEPTPPRAINRSIPKSVEQMCLRCLAKSPVNRYPTAEAFSADLSRYLTRRPKSFALVAGLLLGFGFLAVILSAFMHRGEPNSEDRRRQSPSTTLLPAADPNDLPGDELPLFNDKDLTGWHVHGGQPDEITIKDGVLNCSDSRDLWLRTEAAHSDFRLQFKYCFPQPLRKESGSAVLLRMTGPGQQPEVHWHVYFGGWGTGRIVPPLSALLPSRDGYEPLSGLPKAERPRSEWNEMSVTCDGRSIEVRVNDKLVNKETLAAHGKGHIGFAPLGNMVQLRNIRLQSISR